MGAMGRTYWRGAYRVLLGLWLPLSVACGEVTEPGPAEFFCEDYEAACGFENTLGGDAFLDEEDCLSRFAAFGEVQRECVIEHLAFATRGDAGDHCPSAEGADPCDRETAFCDQYARTCEFNNTFGSEPYTDRSDCLRRYDELDADRQQCVLLHLDFAQEGDEDIHCPHAEGERPCD